MTKKDNDDNFSFEITTLAGAKPTILRKLKKNFSIEQAFKKRWTKTSWLALGVNILSWFDQIKWSLITKPKDPVKPLFVIGHWRSGTTLMHNILCDITDASYCTTYQNIFPNNLFAFYHLLRRKVQKAMPDKRPADGVAVHSLFPQEEEFALGNIFYHCFYYWFFFPKEQHALADKYLAKEGLSEADITQWKTEYRRLVKRCMKDVGGKQFVSKNPPNTARIAWLLDLYPDACFIFLHRNPYDTIASTLRFYKGVLPATQHQSINDEDFTSDVLHSYDTLHKEYEKNKHLIPREQLIELDFETFQNAPLETVTEVLKKLNINFALNNSAKEKYQTKKHSTKSYNHSDKLLMRVNEELGSYFNQFGYKKENGEA